MTSFEEKVAAIAKIFEEGEAAGARGDKLLTFVPEGDAIVDELWGKFMEASDEFELLARKPIRDIDAVLVAVTKMRDAVLSWLHYIEVIAVSPEQSIHGDIDAVKRGLADKGFLIDSGRRDSDGKVIWVKRRERDRPRPAFRNRSRP